MLLEAEIRHLYKNLHVLTSAEQEEVLRIAEELERRKVAERCKKDLVAFCKAMQPDYMVGRHHRVLANLLMEIAEGRKDRICVNIPPRHGKSQLVSIYFPAWFLGNQPSKKVLMVSHTTDLAVDFGRKVRNIINSDVYKGIFPTVTLAADSKSAGRWNTNSGGEYYACGVGSALAGRGADLLLVDDPHSEQDVLNGNFDVFGRAYDWFTYGARTRLMPGGRIALVQCMTGDTPVLMADGLEKGLRDIRVGDSVASYANGRRVSAKVLNWASNGFDCVFTIRTTSGRMVRANERHPFLVRTNTGDLQWVRTRNLQPGMSLVSMRDAQDSPTAKLTSLSVRSATTMSTGINAKLGGFLRQLRSMSIHALLRDAQDSPAPLPAPDCVTHVVRERAITRKTLRPQGSRWGTTGSGRGFFATVMDAATRCLPQGGATNTTTRPTTRSKRPTTTHGKYGTPISSTGMGSIQINSMRYLQRKMVSVLSVGNYLASRIQGHIGATSYVLTTATMGATFADSYAMTATSPLGTQRQNKPHLQWQSTSDFTTDPITGITPDGEEEVFDIQVEDTENFIANGIVSHNTRWHMDDLSGRVTRDMTQNEMADQYEIVEFPAILETHGGEEQALWPDWMSLDTLYKTKASMPLFQWNSQYQQKPTAEEAAIVKREWWRLWEKETAPKCEYIIMSLDAAAEKNNRADYTAITVWGVFVNEVNEEKFHQIILLNAIRDRVEFPELKELANKQYKIWKPDAFIVEKKSSGTPLYQELRRTGMVIQEFTPHRGTGDKMARLNSVADIIRAGLVWVPQTRWAEELIEEIAGFPFASHDDLVDSTVMALMRFRQGGFIRLPDDEKDPVKQFKSSRGAGYY